MNKEQLLEIIRLYGGIENVCRIIFADNKDYTIFEGNKTIFKIDENNQLVHVFQNRTRGLNDMGTMQGLAVYTFPVLQIISMVRVFPLDDVTTLEHLKTNFGLTAEDINTLTHNNRH